MFRKHAVDRPLSAAPAARYLHLPRVGGRAEEPRSAGAARPADGGTETILVVEDDEGVRSVARQILTTHGYTVLEAGDGREALRIYREAARPIHLIVADMVMPEISGPELARQLPAMHSEARVLFMSGYTKDAALRQSFLEPGMAFIEKPFTPEALAVKVREVLDAPPPDAPDE